jgi:C_GCAxxG_C_C family probable redox protein
VESHTDRARQLFEQGYNCAQSVFAAFCDETGMSLAQALRLSSSFEGGMGRLREVCGAVTAMFMIAGMKYGYSGPDDDNAKAEHYSLIQSLANEFREQNGSIICRELLGLQEGANNDPVPEARTKAYYQSRPCADLVKCATKITDELLMNGEIK